MDNGDIGEKIGKLLEDPQALSQIMSIAGGLMGNNQGTNTQDTPNRETVPSKDNIVNGGASDVNINTGGAELALPAIANILGKSKKDDPRCNLLYALRPYMSHARAEKIDMLVKLLRLADLAGGFLGSGIL